MVFATKTVGSRTSSPFNGNRPPYKIGNLFTTTTFSGRDAPDKTGASAKPMLIRTIGISVNGYNTSSASSRFGLWASNGTSGYYTDNFDLPNGGSSDASLVSKTITTTTTVNGVSIAGRPCYAGTQYLLGFFKRDTEIFMWDIDSNLSTNVVEDNTLSSNPSNFDNDGNYTSSAGLVFSYGYDVLPIAPTISTVTNSGNDITVSWTAPSDVGGTPITGYRIQRSLDDVTWATIVADTLSTSTSYIDYGQAYGQTYYYRVAAINEVALLAGDTYSGPYSASLSVTLSGVAGNATSTLTINLSSTDAPLTLFSNGGSGIPFDGVEISYGAEKLYTRVVASSLTSDPKIVDAEAAQAIYGIRSLDISGLLNKLDTDVESVARELLWTYYKPDLRIESISIKLNVLTQEQVNTLLNLELDSALRVEFTPRNLGDPIVSVGRIIGIAHEIDKVNHTITIRMSNASSGIFTLDSDRFGILDSEDNILG